MDGQQYLDQISKTNLPKRATVGKKKFWQNKFFIISMIGVVGVLIIVLIGAIIKANTVSEKSLVEKLNLHLTGTISAIDEYQNYIKSSDLRSSSASLKGILSDTNSSVSSYATEKYNLKNTNNYDKALRETAETDSEELKNDLFEAKINGILDRIYAHKMAYEISVIKSEEARIYDITNSSSLKEALDTSYKSLENLYSSFSDFSEAKN